MKNNLLNRIGVPALALAATAAASAANPKAGMLIGYSSVENENAQESVAAKFFKDKIGGEIITPAQLEKIDASKLDCIWIHIDRVEITKGWENLPQVFNDDAVISALKQFVAEGGNLYLSHPVACAPRTYGCRLCSRHCYRERQRRHRHRCLDRERPSRLLEGLPRP